VAKCISITLNLSEKGNPILMINVSPDMSKEIEEVMRSNGIDFTVSDTQEWKQQGKTNKATLQTTMVTLMPRVWNDLEMLWLLRTIIESMFDKRQQD
jgi:hypothetical protein